MNHNGPALILLIFLFLFSLPTHRWPYTYHVVPSWQMKDNRIYSLIVSETILTETNQKLWEKMRIAFDLHHFHFYFVITILIYILISMLMLNLLHSHPHPHLDLLPHRRKTKKEIENQWSLQCGIRLKRIKFYKKKRKNTQKAKKGYFLTVWIISVQYPWNISLWSRYQLPPGRSRLRVCF